MKGWRDVIDFDEKYLHDAKGIVQRANERVLNGKHMIPKHDTINNKSQEKKDATKLSSWKSYLKGYNGQKCPTEVVTYLDLNLKGWRDSNDLKIKALQDAKDIVKRANERFADGNNLLPRQCCKNKNNTYSFLEIQEQKDSTKLSNWKSALNLNVKNNKMRCYDDIRDYLDINLKGWRDRNDIDEKALEYAKDIVKRANERFGIGKNLLPIQFCKKKSKPSISESQEHTDAIKLCGWKRALKGNKNNRCSEDVSNYLDINLKYWRDVIDIDENALQDAKDIVKRSNERVVNGKKLLPRQCCKNKEKRDNNEYSAFEIQEHKDAGRLNSFKNGLKKKHRCFCSDDIRDYLDKNLTGWRGETDTQSISSETSQKSNNKLIIEEESDDEEYVIQPKPKKSMNLAKPSTNSKKESTEQKRERSKTEISVLHQRYKSLSSQNLNKEFNEKPELWHTYHEISEENEESFPEEEIPRNRIIQELDKIGVKRTKLVVDMGCGKAQVAQHFQNDKRFKFINYDHISSNEFVESCDISHLPFEDEYVEICILSLAMWGSNCKEYIKEAHRVLESGGKLYIIEATKRWSEKDENGNNIQGKEGDKLKTFIKENGFEIVKSSVEKFCLFVCTKM